MADYLPRRGAPGRTKALFALMLAVIGVLMTAASRPSHAQWLLVIGLFLFAAGFATYLWYVSRK